MINLREVRGVSRFALTVTPWIQVAEFYAMTQEHHDDLVST